MWRRHRRSDQWLRPNFILPTTTTSLPLDSTLRHSTYGGWATLPLFLLPLCLCRNLLGECLLHDAAASGSSNNSYSLLECYFVSRLLWVRMCAWLRLCGTYEYGIFVRILEFSECACHGAEAQRLSAGCGWMNGKMKAKVSRGCVQRAEQMCGCGWGADQSNKRKYISCETLQKWTEPLLRSGKCILALFTRLSFALFSQNLRHVVLLCAWLLSPYNLGQLMHGGK